MARHCCTGDIVSYCCDEMRRLLSPSGSCSTTGVGLFTKMQNSFGYLTSTGYGGQIWTVAIGETGSFYTAVCLHIASQSW